MRMESLRFNDGVPLKIVMTKKKVHQSNKIGKASQIQRNEAYLKYGAMTMDEAQRKNWAFYEVIEDDL